MTSVTLILAPPVSILLNMIDVWMTIDRHNILNSINKRQGRHNIFQTFFSKLPQYSLLLCTKMLIAGVLIQQIKNIKALLRNYKAPKLF